MKKSDTIPIPILDGDVCPPTNVRLGVDGHVCQIARLSWTAQGPGFRSCGKPAGWAPQGLGLR